MNNISDILNQKGYVLMKDTHGDIFGGGELYKLITKNGDSYTIQPSSNKIRKQGTFTQNGKDQLSVATMAINDFLKDGNNELVQDETVLDNTVTDLIGKINLNESTKEDRINFIKNKIKEIEENIRRSLSIINDETNKWNQGYKNNQKDVLKMYQNDLVFYKNKYNEMTDSINESTNNSNLDKLNKELEDLKKAYKKELLTTNEYQDSYHAISKKIKKENNKMTKKVNVDKLTESVISELRQQTKGGKKLTTKMIQESIAKKMLSEGTISSEIADVLEEESRYHYRVQLINPSSGKKTDLLVVSKKQVIAIGEIIKQHIFESSDDMVEEGKTIRNNQGDKFEQIKKQKQIKQQRDFKGGKTVVSEDVYSFMDNGGSEDEYLNSPEYFVETYFNGHPGQLRDMLKTINKKELISYLNEFGYREIKDWVLNELSGLNESEENITMETAENDPEVFFNAFVKGDYSNCNNILAKTYANKAENLQILWDFLKQQGSKGRDAIEYVVKMNQTK